MSKFGIESNELTGALNSETVFYHRVHAATSAINSILAIISMDRLYINILDRYDQTSIF
jgi:hypothetical protein